MRPKRVPGTSYIDVRFRISEDELPECFLWFSSIPSRQRQQTLRSILVQSAQQARAVSGASSPPVIPAASAIGIANQQGSPRQDAMRASETPNQSSILRDPEKSPIPPEITKPLVFQETLATGSTNSSGGDAAKEESFDSFADELRLNI